MFINMVVDVRGIAFIWQGCDVYSSFEFKGKGDSLFQWVVVV
jgi:hypothetical protein